jgi:hypothetical protein
MVAGNARSRGSGISCLKSVNKRGDEKRALKPEQIMQIHSPNDTEIVSASSGNDSNLDEGNDTKNAYEGSLNPTESEEEETVEEEMSSEEEEEDDDLDEGGEDEGSSDAKDGDNDTDDEDDTGGPKLVGFVDAMSKILAQNVEEVTDACHHTGSWSTVTRNIFLSTSCILGSVFFSIREKAPSWPVVRPFK